jgi:hypothetical protein
VFKVQPVTDASGDVCIPDPPVVRWLFGRAAVGWLWLVVRLFVGFEFLEAGVHKFVDPAWMDRSGKAILGFWLLTMNVAFMLAGVSATNPVLILFDFLLIMAWKNAGYVELDRYLLGGSEPRGNTEAQVGLSAASRGWPRQSPGRGAGPSGSRTATGHTDEPERNTNDQLVSSAPW